VPREVRLDAALGHVAPRGQEQLALLALLTGDEDAEVRHAADQTLASIPRASVAQTLGRADAPAELVRFFADRGITPAAAGAGAADDDAPLVQAADAWDTIDESATPEAGEGAAPSQSVTQQLQQMSIVERVRAAMKGTREMRAILVRDPNKMVSSAVLASPKLTMAEIESFAKMASVSEDVLRAIGGNRAWVKSYAVAASLARNPKTPVAMSLNLLPRLIERDVRGLSVDRNVPEPLRLAARKRLVKGGNG
jgi:hypothetical protein